MRNGVLVVADSLSAVVRTGPPLLAADPPPTAAAPRMERTAVILFGFDDGPTSSQLGFDDTWADTLMFGDPPGQPGSLDDYYREQTYDQIGFSGDVFGPIDITASSATCNLPADVYAWADEARAILNIDPTYEHFVYVFPDVPACRWAGLAEVGGPARLDQRGVPGSRGRARAGPQPRPGARGRPALHDTGQLRQVPMGDTAASTSGYAVQGSVRRDGPSDPGTGSLVLRQMSMEHKLELNLLPAVGRPDRRRIGHATTSRRWS